MIINREEVGKHNSRDSVWLIIENKVYDVTKFLDDHPGGEEVLLEQAGKDATDIFEDVGHSADARDLMTESLVGQLPESEHTSKEKPKKRIVETEHAKSLTMTQWAITIAVSCGFGFLVRQWCS